ncbi:MAG: dTMP kinase [Coriobacteriia bacterium]|nr:dTMP kinase [Coriobacteriia bacterium]
MQSPSAAFSSVDEQGDVASAAKTPLSAKSNSRRGRFITFEGGDGVGKSSQIYALKRHFEMRGIECEVVREPGGSKVSEAIRDILLNPDNTDLADKTELFLYEAARAQVVEEIIEPALSRGVTVLCDRFFDSTTAYQGFGRGLDLEMIERLNSAACGEVIPDRTLMLDIDVETGLERARRASGAQDRLENENREFHERVRKGFLAIAAADPQRVRVIKADGGVVNVFAEVVEQLKDIFPELHHAESGSVEGGPSSSGDVR